MRLLKMDCLTVVYFEEGGGAPPKMVDLWLLFLLFAKGSSSDYIYIHACYQSEVWSFFKMESPRFTLYNCIDISFEF